MKYRRQWLRMHNRRFTRLTNASSKKWVNHTHAIALHYFYYDFCRKHKTFGMTPAQAARVCEQAWTIRDLVELLEDEEQKIANGERINRAERSWIWRRVWAGVKSCAYDRKGKRTDGESEQVHAGALSHRCGDPVYLWDSGGH